MRREYGRHRSRSARSYSGPLRDSPRSDWWSWASGTQRGGGRVPPQGRVTFAASGTNVLLRVPAGHIAREHLTHLPGAEGVGDAEIDFWCPHDGGYVRVAGGRRPQVCKSLQATGPALEVSGVEDMEHVLRREFSRLSRGLQPERDAWDQGR